ncbi:DUF1490 family protein [Mycobacterium sp. SM1]|uniref:DUF1490 family protein n=1 Tax=Mycobacterium sp. SM1 TaxID=2816243 RepID=UPI001BD0539C|nr:DUF1490 family protein [Mycobacterium sp. SM1]MBS4729464.1 DUF1490 family protein [Mycobacterium sp. SM1]
MTRHGHAGAGARRPRRGQLPRRALSSRTGLWSTTVSSVVTGMVGVAAVEVLAKAPWRKMTVSAAALGLRAARATERMAKEAAEKARLATADVLAEAAARTGAHVAPPPADETPDESQRGR